MFVTVVSTIIHRSGAGGACDCGDKSVMAEEGICPKHKSELQSQPDPVPDELLRPASGILVKILHRLLYELRTLYLQVSYHVC